MQVKTCIVCIVKQRFSALRVLSRFLTVLTCILILAGGLVTSTGSGLSVPDWPLSYGTLFPHMHGGVRFEHTHRLIAGSVAILTFILLIVTLKKENRKWVTRLTWIAFLTVVLQAVLGGITVLYKLPLAVSALHACLAQSFFALAACLTLFHSNTWLDTLPILTDEASSLMRLSIMTSGFIFLQLILGALVRHAHHKTILIFHIVLAFIILLHIILLMIKINRSAFTLLPISRASFFLGLAAVFQFFLGLASFIYKFVLEKTTTVRPSEVIFATLHQTLGALILATSVVLSVLIVKYVKQSGQLAFESSFQSTS
jgi:cytochrome c oxidase assembly protein subunit 15